MKNDEENEVESPEVKNGHSVDSENFRIFKFCDRIYINYKKNDQCLSFEFFDHFSVVETKENPKKNKTDEKVVELTKNLAIIFASIDYEEVVELKITDREIYKELMDLLLSFYK
jgi:hypothetical protein